MVARVLFALIGGPVVGLVLFATSWLFERIVALGAALEGLFGTWFSLVAVWLLLAGVVYAILYGFSARLPKA